MSKNYNDEVLDKILSQSFKEGETAIETLFKYVLFNSLSKDVPITQRVEYAKVLLNLYSKNKRECKTNDNDDINYFQGITIK